MAERANARSNRLWVNVALGSVLVGTVSAWIFHAHYASDFVATSNMLEAATDSTPSPLKWGRIVPVNAAGTNQLNVTDSKKSATVNVAVALPLPRNASSTSFAPQPKATPKLASVIAASSPKVAPAVISLPEPMELPGSTEPAEKPATVNAAAPIQDANAAPVNDELALLETQVKFSAREKQIASPEKLKLGLGQGSTGDAKKGAAKPLHVKVKAGDSLYRILKAKGLPERVLPALLSVDKHGDRLRRIRPGQALELYIDSKGRLERLDYRPDPLTTVSYRRDGSGFASALKETPLDKHERSVSGVIESSLFLDGQRAGLSNRVIMQMAEIFGWDVDFALDIRGGDRFTTIYEELHKDGQKFRDGDILAAEFINRGRVFRAVRFVTPTGDTEYYTPEGRSMRKAFLRTPVRFARISSRFNLRRKHPVLHKVRAHRGVDYAAPIGTPIKATGAGRIEFLGRKGGYGKTIIIRHTGGKYTTLYAHMHRYAKKLRRGSAVKQGQTIGYVGKTGLATGPHLHYEFRVRGRHKDPLRVRLPKSLPIASKHKRAFQRQTRKLVAHLNSSGATVAQSN